MVVLTSTVLHTLSSLSLSEASSPGVQATTQAFHLSFTPLGFRKRSERAMPTAACLTG